MFEIKIKVNGNGTLNVGYPDRLKLGTANEVNRVKLVFDVDSSIEGVYQYVKFNKGDTAHLFRVNQKEIVLSKKVLASAGVWLFSFISTDAGIVNNQITGTYAYISEPIEAVVVDGILEYDEANEKAFMAGLKRISNYKIIIKSLYAQFFHLLMSNIDALCLKMLTSCGYKEDDYTKMQFDNYMQKLQGDNPIAFRQYENYQLYDRAFTVWNFLKHNSLRAYKNLKTRYPNMIWDPGENYQNGESALSVVKLDEKFILDCINNLHLFFDELCEKSLGENADDAQWDYDDYFLEKVQDQIDVIMNPLGL